MFLFRVFFLFLLTIALYTVMLSSDFKIMDDQFSIVNNLTVQNTSKWPQLFKEGYFRDHSYYRPLTNLSYGIEYKIFGFKPFYYHLDNVLIHIANAFLVWWLAAILINAEAGFWVALLFAIHPLQWEAVANISGRAILLSSFFSLLVMVAFIRDRMFIAMTFLGLGLLCKESAAMTPGILLIYVIVYRKRLSKLCWLIPVLAAYLYARHALGITDMILWNNTQEMLRGFVTFLRSVIMYLRMFILPVDLHFDRSMRIVDNIFGLTALLTIFFWISVCIAIWINRQRMPALAWFSLGWFLLTLLPIAQVVTSIGVQPGYISCAEHFLYMTVIPVFLCVVDGVYRVRNNALRLCFIGVCLFFAATTIEQNIYAKSELAMVERSLSYQPHNARLNATAGLIHAINNRFTKAEAYFRMAVADDPQNARYLISLGKSVCDQGRYQECLAIYNVVPTHTGYDKMLNENKAAALKLMRK